MKFLKAITPTIKKEIRIKTPDGEQVLTAVWLRPKDDERITLLGEINAGAERIGMAADAAAQTAAIKAHITQSRERIKHYLRDWDFKDDDLSVEFSEVNLNAMLDWHEYRGPLDASLVSVLTLSDDDAKMGNSMRQGDTSLVPTNPEK